MYCSCIIKKMLYIYPHSPAFFLITLTIKNSTVRSKTFIYTKVIFKSCTVRETVFICCTALYITRSTAPAVELLSDSYITIPSLLTINPQSPYNLSQNCIASIYLRLKYVSGSMIICILSLLVKSANQCSMVHVKKCGCVGSYILYLLLGESISFLVIDVWIVPV